MATNLPEDITEAEFSVMLCALKRDEAGLTDGASFRYEFSPPDTSHEPVLARKKAQLVLLSFLVTFICARVSVFLIMARIIPDLYLHVGGTHVHHLNFGIFLLVGLGAWLVLQSPTDLKTRWPAVIYGVGLALTFDEFGMWLHLGGIYWQRASWDAIVVLAAVLAFFAFGPSVRRYRSENWLMSFSVLAMSLVFCGMLVKSLDYAGKRFLPGMQRLEANSPL